ncbi:YsnF/AvaK domain-containing protein [Altericista sp. CCNU0014]|uniref:YsnF/AvaK domain-containing protein n=1 Tax=Altericista sp. CCNU0014 TaxID=3082949 RepID=UPI003850C184
MPATYQKKPGIKARTALSKAVLGKTMASDESHNILRERDFDPKVRAPVDSNTLTPKVFPLLEERLMVNFTRRKSGEVVVRKEVETRTIEIKVPVRREKLIVEQIVPEYKMIAEIDLEDFTLVREDLQESTIASENLKLSSININETRSSALNRTSSLPELVKGEFNSVQDARDFLDAISASHHTNCETFCIEIALRGSTQ